MSTGDGDQGDTTQAQGTITEAEWTVAPPDASEPLATGPAAAGDVPFAAIEAGGIQAQPRERYRRISLLGVGGMGEVALCRDEWVGREVALKTLREPRAESPAARALFFQEMRVQAQLDHPSIVPVYDFGVDPEGRMFFTMRPVRGRTLKQVLDDVARRDEATLKKSSRHKLLTLLLSVCLAVHYAHTRGVLHRDLKPSNIMLGDFGEVYVLDWGIAKVAREAAAADGQSASLGGSLVGTPAYVAPEQLLRKRVIDARADVYALGMILFEVLAEQPLHLGRETADIIETTLAGLDTRPSARAPDVPPELDAICVRAMARDPAQRFATVQEMASAIERFLEGDRDLALRRATAAEHAEKATEATARATSPAADAATQEAARADAMREVVRSLAFDPMQVAATRTLVELLVRVPDKMPADAEKEMENATFEARLESAKMACVTFVAWLGFTPFALIVGVRSWFALALSVGLCLVCLAFGLWVWKGRRLTSPYVYTLAGLSAAATASMISWVGPFMVVSMAAAVMTLLFIIWTTRRERRVVTVIGVLMILVPVGLQVLGIVPPSYAFEGGNMVVLARGYELPQNWTLGILFYTSLAWILFPAIIVGRMRDALSGAQRMLFLHAWHFRRLLPDASAQGAAGGQLPTSA